MRIIFASAKEYSEPDSLQYELNNLKINSPSSVDWRVLEHTLTVTHLYALFEQFFEETIADWMDFLASAYIFHQLPAKMQAAYQAGFAKVVGKLPSPRFTAFTVNNLVADFHEALKGGKTYRLEPNFITYRSNNLRWNEICEIISRCDIPDLNGWVNANDRVLGHLRGPPQNNAEQIESRLADFVQYRNDCSHGVATPDEILGHDDLLEMIEFVTVIADSLSQLISWKKVETLLNNNRAKHIGKADEVYHQAGAIVVQSSNTTISVGQKLYWKTGGNFGVTEVLSLRVNDVNMTTIDTTDPIAVGLKLTFLPKKGTKLLSDVAVE